MIKDTVRHLNEKLSTEYYQQGTLEKDLWFRVATRDYTELIKTYDFAQLFSRFPSTLELLDVGCGTGKFPSMLSSHLSPNLHVQYDYLDPSQHSLEQLQKTLSPPFTPRSPLKATLETLERSACPPQGYHIIWCLQSLYCLQRLALRETVGKLHALLNPSCGVGLIYLASSEACYHQLYNLYNQEFYPNTRQPYITAEDVTKTFDALALPYEVKKFQFPHTIGCSEHHVLENYVDQCVFDSKAWENSQNNESVKNFLESFRHSDEYQFPQQVWLIQF